MSAAQAEQKFTYNVCQGYGCHDHCILKTFVSNGKIVRTERVVLPPPDNGLSGNCQKGIMAGRIPYAADRILYPLKRIGERGEGKFERISWDQALDEIGAKINQIAKDYGTQAVGILPFPCGIPPVFGLWNVLGTRFANAFGGTYLWPTSIDTGSFYSGFIDFGTAWNYGQHDPRPIVNSKYIILWGTEPITTRPGWRAGLLMEAQEKGAKIVHIGLTYNPTAAKSDWFIPVRPATDASLALSMCYVIISEALYNEEFLAKYTVAPFLVRQDTGNFLRESDIVQGGDPQKYVIWSKAPSKPYAVPAHTFAYSNWVEPDLQASLTYQGIPCKTAFVMLKEHLAKYTPEAQETITGVPAEVVRQLTHEYVESKPSTIWYDWGGAGRYLNGGRTHRAINLVPILTGNLNKLGLIISSLSYGWPASLNDMGIAFPDGVENARGKSMLPQEWYKAVTEGVPYPIKAVIVYAGNLIQANPNWQAWEQFFRKADLLVNYEIRMTDTSMWMDYVLPDVTVLEKYDLINPMDFNHITLNEPAIEPIGEGKPPADLWRELAQRINLTKYFDKTTEQWLDLWLKSENPAIKGITPPLTFERLKKEKIVRLNVPEEPFDPFGQLDFLTPSGRMEFYCEDLAPIDEAMAKQVEPLIRSPRAKGYPLQFYTGRSRFFMQTQFTNIPELAKLAGGGTTMRMNPKDAAARGIVEGNVVEAYNERGSCKTKVVLSESLPVGTVHLWFGWPKSTYISGFHKMLLAPISLLPDTDDSLRLAWEKLAKKRTPQVPAIVNWEVYCSTGWDTMWDAYCEVRKVEEVAK
jgi:molybdopterin-containing oxidoreductase family molybdopterin binding subunit